MRTHAALTGCLLVALLLAGGTATAQEPSPIERLRSLAGDWEVLDAQGESTDLTFSYAVNAGGAAVVETGLVGSDQETVTLYHSEAGLVTVTQISRRGRPDRLVPAEAPDGTTLVFANDSESTDDGRLREARLTFLEENRIRVTWTHAIAEDGFQATSFELRRLVALEELADRVARVRVTLDGLQRELDRRLKRRTLVATAGKAAKTFLETRTLPTDPGWNHAGTPFRTFLQDQTIRFASTYAADSDAGHTLAHFPFKAGRGCRVRFSALGGHGYIAVVAEKRSPPRKGVSIEEVSRRLLEGEFGDVVERVVGGRWTVPVAFEWDLSRYEGQALRLYVVDAASDHYGQIAVSEISITEEAAE